MPVYYATLRERERERLKENLPLQPRREFNARALNEGEPKRKQERTKESAKEKAVLKLKSMPVTAAAVVTELFPS